MTWEVTEEQAAMRVVGLSRRDDRGLGSSGRRLEGMVLDLGFAKKWTFGRREEGGRARISDKRTEGDEAPPFRGHRRGGPRHAGLRGAKQAPRTSPNVSFLPGSAKVQPCPLLWTTSGSSNQDSGGTSQKRQERQGERPESLAFLTMVNE